MGARENRDQRAFAVYREGLTEALPYRCLFNSPIAEAPSRYVGYAMAGGRAVVELMYCDFLGRCAGDEVFNQMAMAKSMSAGLLKMPLSCACPRVRSTVPQHSCGLERSSPTSRA